MGNAATSTRLRCAVSQPAGQGRPAVNCRRTARQAPHTPRRSPRPGDTASMQAFSGLFERLDQATGTTARVLSLIHI